MGDLSNGESLGIPDDLAQQAQMWRPRRSIFDALIKSNADIDPGMTPHPTGPQADLDPRMTPQPRGPQRDIDPGMTPRLVDRINDDPAQPLHSGMETPDMPSSGMNDTPYGPQPTHMTEMEDEYQRLGPHEQPPMSLKQKLITGGLGALKGVLAPGAVQQQVQQKQLQQGRNDQQRGRLLTEMEAERRMQEQSDMAQPEHMDTDQGPIQFNRQTKQWEPIQIGGQRVGPKAQPKPDNPEQQFFDSPEEANKPLSQRITDYANLTKPSNQKPDTPEQQFFDSPEEAGKTLGQKISDYASKTQKPERGDAGSFQLDEDGEGNSIMFNTKTGQTRPASGIHKSGTYAKGMGAAQDAQNYADLYLKSGQFTGAGDEALMEKYFELAKPSSGFRMTQSQQDMLKQSRSWMGSAEGIAYHAKTGQWFTPEQRQQIQQTMQLLSQAKQQSSSSSGGAKLKDRVAGKVLVEGKDF